MKIFIHTLLLALLVLATKAHDDVCNEEDSNLSACESALADQGAACVACYVDALGGEVPAGCKEGYQFCAGFNRCRDSCGDCVDEVLAVVDCAANNALENCHIDCSSAPAGHLAMTLFSVVGAMVALPFILLVL